MRVEKGQEVVLVHFPLEGKEYTGIYHPTGAWFTRGDYKWNYTNYPEAVSNASAIVEQCGMKVISEAYLGDHWLPSPYHAKWLDEHGIKYPTLTPIED